MFNICFEVLTLVVVRWNFVVPHTAFSFFILFCVLFLLFETCILERDVCRCTLQVRLF